MTRRVYTARPYQHIITDHITSTPRCAIWAGMGMGKSVSTLTAIDAEILCGESTPTLILGPLRVARDVWPDEVKKWSHLSGLSIVPVTGNEAQRRKALSYDVPIHSTNYEQLPWLIDHFGSRWPYGRVIADESTKLKGFRTKQGGQRAQALGQVAHLKQVKNFVELTGTPAPNGLLDVWGQMWFLDSGQRLGRTFTGFRDRWFRKDYDGRSYVPFDHSQKEIQDKLRDLCLTIDAADWFPLEKPIINDIYVDLPVKAMILYREMEKNLYIELEGHGVEAFNGASKTMKMLQISNGAAYVDPLVESDDNPKSKEWKHVHDAKLEALGDIIEELGGNPLMVAYHFKSDLARLMRAFPNGQNLGTVEGMKNFKSGRYAVCFCHAQSVGHGVDGLQDHCHNLVFFGHNWNLEERMQLIERIGPVRQIQANTGKVVTIHNIIARNTVDELVIARNDSKRSVQAILLEAMKKRRGR